MSLAQQEKITGYHWRLFTICFPGTAIRGTATGFCFNAERAFTAAAVLFVGVLESRLGGYANALFIFSFIFIPGLIVTLFTKEKNWPWHIYNWKKGWRASGG